MQTIRKWSADRPFGNIELELTCLTFKILKLQISKLSNITFFLYQHKNNNLIAFMWARKSSNINCQQETKLSVIYGLVDCTGKVVHIITALLMEF